MAHTIKQFQHSKKIWVETKYDGERAQIHVQVDETGKSRITIFSKSQRDSTLDRFAIHSYAQSFSSECLRADYMRCHLCIRTTSLTHSLRLMLL